MRRRQAALRPRPFNFVAFFPPMARLLSRRPRAPTWDLPSRSCWKVSPRASFRLDLARLRLFSLALSYFDAPASLSAMAIAWRGLLTLPPLPLGPLLSSPCLNSCITRPMVLRCRGDVLAMAISTIRVCLANVEIVERFHWGARRGLRAACRCAARDGKLCLPAALKRGGNPRERCHAQEAGALTRRYDRGEADRSFRRKMGPVPHRSRLLHSARL